MVGLNGIDPLTPTCKEGVIPFHQRPKKLVPPNGNDPFSEDFQSSANPSQLQRLGVNNEYRSRASSFTERGATITPQSP